MNLGDMSLVGQINEMHIPLHALAASGNTLTIALSSNAFTVVPYLPAVYTSALTAYSLACRGGLGCRGTAIKE